MPRPRFEKLDPEKREAILNAALEAFATHGFDGASYNQIIERAGVSKGAMYYYFDDKEDLYATVVRRELAGLWDQFHTIPEISTVREYWEMMNGFIEGIARFALEQPMTMGLMRGVLRMKSEGIHSPVIQEIHEMGSSFATRFLELGQQIGAVRTDVPLEMLSLIINAVDEAGDFHLIENVDEMSEEALRDWGQIFVDVIHRIVAPRVEFPEETP